MRGMEIWLMVLAGSMALASTVSLGFYAWDKRRAVRGGWRVPESRLHLISLIGGWPGAIVGQRWLRHKTAKRRFRLVFWLTVLLHGAASAGVTWLVWRSAGR